VKGLLVSIVLVLSSSLALAQVSVVRVPGVRVKVGHPAVRVEHRPPAPSAAAVWVPGYWAWRGNKHVWIAGFWGVPPRPGYVWVEPRWVPEGGQFVFYEGFWGAPAEPPAPVVYEPPVAPAQPAVATMAPPAPIAEVRPRIPVTGAVWIPGRWEWTGAQYVWVAGQWSAPRRGFTWVDGRWLKKGGQWYYVAGHWTKVR
jgi:hypothetical protein